MTIMICQQCENQCDVDERFCRKCGSDLQSALPLPIDPHSLKRRSFASAKARSKDPDELAGNGIGCVFVGDGFLMVAVILSATNTSISSLLWLLLLIPAFFFFGKGFANVFQARQIRRHLKQMELQAAPTNPELIPPRATIIDAFKNYTSAELIATSSVTERTTRELE